MLAPLDGHQGYRQTKHRRLPAPKRTLSFRGYAAHTCRTARSNATKEQRSSTPTSTSSITRTACGLTSLPRLAPPHSPKCFSNSPTAANTSPQSIYMATRMERPDIKPHRAIGGAFIVLIFIFTTSNILGHFTFS